MLGIDRTKPDCPCACHAAHGRTTCGGAVMTEEEMLIRQAVTDEANEAVDAATVLAGLREARPKRRRTGMLVAVAGFAVAAAVVAVVVPLTASRETAPVPPASAPNKPVPVTEENILLVGLDEADRTDTIILVRHNA